MLQLLILFTSYEHNFKNKNFFVADSQSVHGRVTIISLNGFTSVLLLFPKCFYDIIPCRVAEYTFIKRFLKKWDSSSDLWGNKSKTPRSKTQDYRDWRFKRKYQFPPIHERFRCVPFLESCRNLKKMRTAQLKAEQVPFTNNDWLCPSKNILSIPSQASQDTFGFMYECFWFILYGF